MKPAAQAQAEGIAVIGHETEGRLAIRKGFRKALEVEERIGSSEQGFDIASRDR